LAELVQYNLKTVRAYLLKEQFQFFWGYKSWYWAGQFLDRWCKRTMRSRLEPMKKVARMLRAHRPLILNWFRAKGAMSSGIVEGFNNKAKLSIRKAYGFRTFHGMEIRPRDRCRTGVRCELAYTVLISLSEFKRLPRES